LATTEERDGGEPEFRQRRSVGNHPHDQQPITPWWYGPSEYSSCTHACFSGFCLPRREHVEDWVPTAVSSGCGHDWPGVHKQGLYCKSDSEPWRQLLREM